jgi:alpha-mannosidase
VKRYELHVVPHTHWDREWYLPFEQFRFRLVRMVDRLISLLEQNPDYAHFSLDGQTVVLEDYLALRPENRARLAALIGAGRVAVGPWYVLPDEWLVSGEALVRNLLRGRRTAREFGGGMPVGYVPDMFGHIAQMPQILRGFGLENAILFRGLSGSPEQLKSEFLWEALDGSRVLAVKLSDHLGYSNALEIPAKTEAGLKKLREIAEERMPYATTPYLLGLNGADHREAEPDIARLAREASARFDDLDVVHSSLGAYMELLAQAVDRNALQVIRGELRQVNRGGGGGLWNFLLPHVLSSRVYLKLANDRCQRLLERWAEPFAALAWAAGGVEYPKAFLDQAWAYLLKCHPHDDIGGCSVDAVHRSMAAHFEWAGQIGEQVRDESLKAVADRVDTTAVGAEEIPLVVFNPSPFPRSGLVTAKVRLPVDRRYKGITLTDPEGRDVPCSVGAAVKRIHVPNFEAWPPDETGWVLEVPVRFRAEAVPGLGWAVFTVKTQRKPVPLAGPLVTGINRMENEHLAVTVQPNGALTVTHKASGRTYLDLGAFEDGADIGDGYTYSDPREDRVYSSVGCPAEISLVESTPFAATYRVDLRWRLPASATPDRQGRSEETAELHMTQFITLEAGARRVDIRTVVSNNIKDHRLRVLFPTGIGTDRSYAATQFGVVERPIATRETPLADWNEQDPAEQQMVGFAGVEGSKGEGSGGEPGRRSPASAPDGRPGLALLAQGLLEYAVLDRPDRALALTLLRATTNLASPDTQTRWFSCGPEVFTPEGQCQGTHEFRYAIFPYEGGREKAGVVSEAEAHNHPFETFQTAGGHAGTLALRGGFVTVQGGLVLSAVKQGEDRPSLIVRLYNPGIEWAAGAVRLNIPVKEAWRVDLAEERQEPCDLSRPVAAGPQQIITLEVVPV